MNVKQVNDSKPCFHLRVKNKGIDDEVYSLYEDDLEHKTNLFIEDKQQESIMEFYEGYTKALDNIKNTKPGKLKRTFDEYIGIVEETYLQKMRKTVCQLYKQGFDLNRDFLEITKHPDHSESGFKALNDEFYMLFKVLYVHWIDEELTKHDAHLISPCKIFLTQTIIDRKYGNSYTFK